MLEAGVRVSPDTYWAGVFFFFFFGVIPGNTQGQLLTLHSGFTQGTIWDAGDPTQVNFVQGKHPTHHTITPVPHWAVEGGGGLPATYSSSGPSVTNPQPIL